MTHTVVFESSVLGTKMSRPHRLPNSNVRADKSYPIVELCSSAVRPSDLWTL